MKEVAWKKVGSVSSESIDRYSILKKGKVISIDKGSLEKRLKKWVPQNAFLVGIPGARNYQLLTQVPPSNEYCLRSTFIFNRNMLAATSVPLLLLIFVSIILGSIKALPLLSIFLPLPLVYLFDVYHFTKMKNIESNARFFYWLHSSGEVKRSFWFLSLVMAGIGLLQLFCVITAGNVAYFEAVGGMYESIDEGQYWRLLTGAYLHYSFMHYAINFFLLVSVGTLSAALIGSFSTLFVFLLGNVAGVFFQYVWGEQVLGSVGGVSFGVYAVSALLIVKSLNDKLLPVAFIFKIVTLILFGIISSEILFTNAATVGHIAGVMVGVVAAALANQNGTFSQKKSIGKP